MLDAKSSSKSQIVGSSKPRLKRSKRLDSIIMKFDSILCIIALEETLAGIGEVSADAVGTEES